MNEYAQIPVATPLIQTQPTMVCARCYEEFTPSSDTKKGTASNYRCPTCLTFNAIAKDTFNSICSIS